MRNVKILGVFLGLSIASFGQVVGNGDFSTDFTSNTDANGKWLRSAANKKFTWNAGGYAVNTAGSSKGSLRQTVNFTTAGTYEIEFKLDLTGAKNTKLTLSGGANATFEDGSSVVSGFGTVGGSETVSYGVVVPTTGEVTFIFTKSDKSTKIAKLDDFNIAFVSNETTIDEGDGDGDNGNQSSNTSATKKYRLALKSNPATSVMIGWESYGYVPDKGDGTPGFVADNKNPILYYDTTDHGQDYNLYANSIPTNSLVFKDALGMRNTFAELTGLTPDTNYYFVIKDDQGVSDRFYYKTAPNTNATLPFISGGDSRGGGSTRDNANKLVAKLKPTAIFFGGDYNSSKTSASQWSSWLQSWQFTIAKDGRMFPIVNTRGNHDSGVSIDQIFNTGSSLYYEVQFGNNLLSIFTLNTQNGYPNAQRDWFANAAAASNSIWKTAQYHKPIRPHTDHKDEGVKQHERWLPTIEANNFQLVFESDSHTLKRTWPIVSCDDEGQVNSNGHKCEQGFRRDDQNGTVYVGEGCWGAGLRDDDDAKEWTRDFAKIDQLKWFCVSPTEINLRAIIVNKDNASGSNENDNSRTCDVPQGIQVWNPSYSFGDPNNLHIPSLPATHKRNWRSTGNDFQGNGAVVTISNATLSDNKYDVNNKLAIGPNPTSGIITIANAKNGYSCDIYSLEGKLVAKKTIANQTVNISDVTSGLYLMKIYDENQKLVSINKVNKI